MQALSSPILLAVFYDNDVVIGGGWIAGNGI